MEQEQAIRAPTRLNVIVWKENILTHKVIIDQRVLIIGLARGVVSPSFHYRLIQPSLFLLDEKPTLHQELRRETFLLFSSQYSNES